MKKQDLEYLKQQLKNDYWLNNFLSIIQTNEHTIKIMYNFKVITITDNIGYAYLISWWCDGSITSIEAQHLDIICKKYNDRF